MNKWALGVNPLSLTLLLAQGLQLFHQQVLPTLCCCVLGLTWLWLPLSAGFKAKADVPGAG